jgi:hypothetical protein
MMQIYIYISSFFKSKYFKTIGEIFGLNNAPPPAPHQHIFLASNFFNLAIRVGEKIV